MTRQSLLLLLPPTSLIISLLPWYQRTTEDEALRPDTCLFIIVLMLPHVGFHVFFLYLIIYSLFM